jgi:hypothetical protein
MKRPGVRRLFRFSRRSREGVREDVHEEFKFHIQMRTEELVRSGLTDAEARARPALWPCSTTLISARCTTPGLLLRR